MNLKIAIFLPIFLLNFAAYAQVAKSKAISQAPCEKLVISANQKPNRYIELSTAVLSGLDRHKTRDNLSQQSVRISV